MKRAVDKEQFFTDRALAQRCVAFTADLLPLDSFAAIVEPSAGDGAFFDVLPPDRRVGLDIDPRADGIERADFLSWSPAVEGPVLTIGNPPFGARGALAIAFLRHACSFSDAVAFVLPRSFNKYTFQDRVPDRFHLAGSFDCEEEFTIAGAAPRSVRTVFQVWQRRETERTRPRRAATHPDFDMRHCHLSRVSAAELESLRAAYPFAIAQVGSDFRPRPAATVVRGSHWFIRPAHAEVERRFARLDFGFLAGMNTAHTSLSKRDIVAAYQAVVDGERT
ncbi:MAG: hypothetical protein QOI42_957 [Frankiaceae bacterium]|nr:hypothetical protein [Frankiaceae bacterium]